jgi:cysteine desulfurase
VSAGEVLMPAPLITGGGQEKGHRGGTENLVGIAGFGAAAEAALVACAGSGCGSCQAARPDGSRDARSGARHHHSWRGCARLANTSFFSLPGLKAETAQIAFDMEGVAVSAGAACSSGKIGESHVLKAMGADAALGAIRISLGTYTQDEDIDAFLEAFKRINSRRMARLGTQAAA